MPPKNKVVSSPHRDEIDKLLLDGESSRNVANYLKNQYNEIISYATINNYRKVHLNVTKEAKKIYNKKRLKGSQKKPKPKKSKPKPKPKKSKTQKLAEKKVKLAEKKSKSRVDKKAQKLVGNIEELDSIILEMNEVNLEIDETLSQSEEIDPIKLLQFKLRCKELEIKAIKIKYDILKDDDTGPVINVNINEKLDRLKRIEHNVNNSDE